MSRVAYLHSLLGRFGILAAWRAVRPGDLVLCYHNVLATGAAPQGDASLHLPRERFEQQLDWIAARYDVVSTEVISLPAPQGARPRAAITFDDAYIGVLRHALPALRVRRLPSTIYVASGFAESPRPFWWDVLATRAAGLDRIGLRDRHAGVQEAILLATGLSDAAIDLSEDYVSADWSLLRAVLDADLTIGSHSVSHPMLSHMEPDRLRDELVESRTAIHRQLRVTPRSIAYPYGDVSPAVSQASMEAGYDAAFTIAGGLLRFRDDMFTLPRLNIPSRMPLSAFATAASGLRVGRGSR
jgi:peptidoglycan/xylan/chitin deacetylase (PgdA/CDA1 family)